MPKLEDIGRGVLMHHRSSGEKHYGKVEDITSSGYIIYMNETASHLLDKYRFIDMRYDSKKWRIVRFTDEQ